jgi:hypothetical protein
MDIEAKLKPGELWKRIITTDMMFPVCGDESIQSRGALSAGVVKILTRGVRQCFVTNVLDVRMP